MAPINHYNQYLEEHQIRLHQHANHHQQGYLFYVGCNYFDLSPSFGAPTDCDDIGIASGSSSIRSSPTSNNFTISTQTDSMLSSQAVPLGKVPLTFLWESSSTNRETMLSCNFPLLF